MNLLKHHSDPTKTYDMGQRCAILRDIGLAPLLLTHRAVVAGGFWRSWFDQTEVMDIDVFCLTKTSAIEIIKGLEASGFEATFVCPAGELHTMFHSGKKLAVQVISKDGCFTGDIEALIDAFDFTACQMAASSDLTTIYFGETSIEDAMNKQLRLHCITYAAHSMRRSYKYAAKGYEIHMADVLEMVQLMATQEGLDVMSFYKGGVD